jgi:hypothetical protein
MTTYEQQARENKCGRIVAACRKASITVADLKSGSENDWRLAAVAAGVPPLSEETRRMVIAEMSKEQR